MWQDYAIMMIQFAFSAALLPSVFGPAKPERLTCALTGVLLYALATIYTTLNLWIAAFSGALLATLWIVMLFQRRPNEGTGGEPAMLRAPYGGGEPSSMRAPRRQSEPSLGRVPNDLSEPRC